MIDLSGSMPQPARHRVCSLAAFAALVQSANCQAVIGTMTGPIQLAQMIHANRLVVIDMRSVAPRAL